MMRSNVLTFPTRRPAIAIERDEDGTFAVILNQPDGHRCIWAACFPNLDEAEGYAASLASERGWLLERLRCAG